jgi:hypothetical protein
MYLSIGNIELSAIKLLEEADEGGEIKEDYVSEYFILYYLSFYYFILLFYTYII